jgi:signal peptidase II
MSDEEKQGSESSSEADAKVDAEEKRAAGDEGEDEPAREVAGAERRASRRRAERRTLEVDESAPADEPAKPKPDYVFFGIATVIAAALDLGSKEWAANRLAEPGSKIVVIENFMHFDLATNKGGAWGFLGDQPDSVRLPFFFAISAFAVWFIVRMYRQLEPRQTALKWALPLVLGGAVGNLVDRIRHQHVIDFIDCFATIDGQVKHWPTYNVADIWIVVGVALMLIDGFTTKPATKKVVVKRVKVKSEADKTIEPAG